MESYQGVEKYSYNQTYSNDTGTRGTINDFGSTNIIIRGLLTLLLRAGFILIQIGSIPVTNVQIILLQNILDIACSTVGYCIVGYILTYGCDVKGLIGTQVWIMSDNANMDKAVIGWTIVLTTTAIFTTMVAGRMHFLGHITVIGIFSTLIEPILLHWVWASSSWMHKFTFSGQKVFYRDKSGASVIHLSGGILALFGGLFLGRRILLLREIDESSLPPSSPGNVATGYIFLIIGLMGLSFPIQVNGIIQYPINSAGIIVMNNIMAIAGGIITVVVLESLFAEGLCDYWVNLHCMQGAVAAIVTVAAGIDVYKPLITFGLSLAGAFIFFFGTKKIILPFAIEDCANVISAHLLCGFLGILLPPLCGSNEEYGINMALGVGWQLICSTAILGVVIVFSLLIFLILLSVGLLRNGSEETNHKRALTALARGPKRHWLQRIFTLNGGNEPYLKPGYQTKLETIVSKKDSFQSSSISSQFISRPDFSTGTAENTGSSGMKHEKDHSLTSTTSRTCSPLLQV